MKHFHFETSALDRLGYYSNKYNCKFYAKRDDLQFLEIGGGNKARMLQYLLYDLSPDKYDVLVTAGGPCSNFNRACALMCARQGVRFHLVEYTDEPSEFDTSLNYKLCLLSGMETTRCDKRNVPATIQSVVERMKQEGLRVKLIYGGGKSLEGVYSYYDAVAELSRQTGNVDYLFVACGTGTTLTGICAGMQKRYPDAEVHAISTARTFDVEKETLDEDMSMLNHYLHKEYTFQNLTFHEEYLCGGYAKYDSNIMSTIQECASKEGMLIDPTYSGKAFHGMLNIIEQNKVKFKGKHIVFWNTGGMFNLLSELK